MLREAKEFSHVNVPENILVHAIIIDRHVFCQYIDVI